MHACMQRWPSFEIPQYKVVILMRCQQLAEVRGSTCLRPQRVRSLGGCAVVGGRMADVRLQVGGPGRRGGSVARGQAV